MNGLRRSAGFTNLDDAHEVEHCTGAGMENPTTFLYSPRFGDLAISRAKSESEALLELGEIMGQNTRILLESCPHSHPSQQAEAQKGL